MQTVQVSILRDIIFAAVKNGVDYEGACHEVGLTPEDLRDADRHVHWEKVGVCWNYCVEKTEDPFLGLHIGQQPGLAFLGTLSYLANNCRSVSEAYHMIMRFNKVVTSIFQYDLVETPQGVTLVFEPSQLYMAKYPEAARQAVELSMSNLLTMINMLTLRNVTPLRIEQSFGRRNTAEYERILRAPIVFHAPINGVHLSRSDFEMPVVRQDQSLFTLLHHVLEERLKAVQEGPTFSERIRKTILFNFKGQAPPIEAIANHFHLTTRTLQRRLSDEETSYRDLVNELNAEITDDLLSLKITKEKIASLLGYADSSGMRKSLRVKEL